MVWMMAQDVRIKVNDGKYELHELTHIPSSQFDEGEASSMCSTKELIESKQSNISFFIFYKIYIYIY